MANQIAVRCHTNRGDEVLLHEGCHTYRFEQGGMAALHGVQARALPGARGEVPIEVLEAEIRADDQHFPRTRLVVLENTFNWGGGSVLRRDYVRSVLEMAGRRALRVHLDGARLMNAAAASGCPASELCAGFDSVTLCLSKALGAPVGTMLGGTASFIAEARRARKLLGGGMRQAGILAAAGLLAIGDPPNLQADHARARRLASGLGGIPGVTVAEPETNIVVATIAGMAPPALLERLRSAGVLAVGFGPGRIRFVTHRDVGDDDVAKARSAMETVLGGGGRR
jgi:threonine aldolase